MCSVSFFLIGLVFAATVVIPNVDAIWCYVGLGYDEEGRIEANCRSGVSECYKLKGELSGKHMIVESLLVATELMNLV